MMTTEELRASFVAFAGQPAARRFSLQLRGDKEGETGPPYRQRRVGLRFWQEELWNRFTQTFGGVTNDLEMIRAALLWCDVHDRPLEHGHAVRDSCGVTNRDGNRLDQAFRQLWEKEFPFGFGFWTLICPECVNACQEWMDSAGVNRPQSIE